MRSLTTLPSAVLLFSVVVLGAASFGFGEQVVLDFGSENGCGPSYDEDGYRLTAIDSGDGANRLCLRADLPDLNGLLILGTYNTEDVRVQRIDGKPFDLLRLDLLYLDVEYKAVSSTGGSQDLVYNPLNQTISFSGPDWQAIAWFELRCQDIQPPPPLPRPKETLARIDNIVLEIGTAPGPSLPIWEVWTINAIGSISDHGLVGFGPPDPTGNGVGIYAQLWDDDVIQVGQWETGWGCGDAGGWLQAWTNVPDPPDPLPRHPYISGYFMNPVGIFLGECYDDSDRPAPHSDMAIGIPYVP